MTREEKSAGLRLLSAHMEKTARTYRPASGGRLRNSLAAVLFGTAALGIGIAQGAQKALPGETLFPVKLALETARGALIGSPEKRAEWESGLAEKRLNELTALEEQGRLTPAAEKAGQEDFLRHAAKAHMAPKEKTISAQAASRIDAALTAYGALIKRRKSAPENMAEAKKEKKSAPRKETQQEEKRTKQTGQGAAIITESPTPATATLPTEPLISPLPEIPPVPTPVPTPIPASVPSLP